MLSHLVVCLYAFVVCECQVGDSASQVARILVLHA